MSKLFNRAKMTTTTTGTSTITLGSAADGFVTFATAGVVDGDVLRYCIEAENGTDFEIGEAVYSSSAGTRLFRLDTLVQLSSNSNNCITLASGTHNVFITAVDSDFTQEMTATVAGGKFVIDGTSQQIITMLPSITYRIHQNIYTNAGHPLVLASGSADGSTYSTGVRTVGTPGSKGSYTEIKLEQDAPALWYKCSNHSGMGASINIAAPSSGAASAVGTLTKTFSNNEEASITLTSAISPVPNVSVFKEIAQAGLSSKGNWDVNSSASNYTRLDEATSVTLTPSAVGSGTFSLGSGSFSSSDVGKTITGNGGVAVLTSAAGGYTSSTNFTNTNAIASGAWDMHGSVAKSDGSGLTISASEIGYNFASPFSATSPTTTSSALHGIVTSAGGSVSSAHSGGIVVSASGDKVFFVDESNPPKLTCLNASTPFDMSTLSYTNSGNQITLTQIGAALSGSYGSMSISPDGKNFYVNRGSSGAIHQYRIATAYDLSSTVTYVGTTTSLSSNSEIKAVMFKDGFTGFRAIDGYLQGGGNIRQFTMTNSYDIINSCSLDSEQSSSIMTRITSAALGADGKSLICSDQFGSSTTKFFTLSTAWDISTHGSGTTIANLVENSFGFSPTGKHFYAQKGAAGIFKQWLIGSETYPTSQYFPSVTAASGQIDSSSWTDINSMVADETAGSGTLSYAISTDNHVTWKVLHNTNGTRSIAKNNSGTWQVNTNATYGSETWANATTNTELSALQQALATANNRMNKAQLDAVADANHITLGNTLDLMIATYIASGSTAPISDGVTINYDSEALVRMAINGTDYEAEFPSSTSVKIKSLAAQNLKVRVL